MNVKKNIAFTFLLIIGLISQVKAAVLEVTNTFDSGDGSLRSQINAAVSGDTVLVNVKGLITLNSPINIIGKSNLTLIGPYPKHNQITAGGIWTGSLFNIESSGPIRIKGIGFEGGNGNTRHVSVVDGLGDVSFDMCLFQNNTVTVAGHRGGAVFARNANVNFNACSFINNQCDRGGAIYTGANVGLYCINSTFSRNKGNTDAGVVRMTGGGSSTLTIMYSTFVYNEGASGSEVIRTNTSIPVLFENNAIGYNGTTQQLSFGAGSFSSNGGNAIRKNFAGEGGIDLGDLSASDEFSDALDFHLRGELLEDGYGLKYWTIINSASDLINQQAPTVNTPSSDCRRAPRSLKGPSASLAYPDAGACEYTHLRVTNTGGLFGANSFLWALEFAQQKDAMHYIEFDIDAPSIPSISIGSDGILSDRPYIIDGYSQPTSSVPGPPASGSSELTPATLPIVLTSGASAFNGLTVATGSENSVIQGLRLTSFDGNGIRILVNDIRILGCEIGINAGGTLGSNGRMGIRLESGAYNCKIGGWEHWMRNVVTGNGVAAASIRCNIGMISANNNAVSGNIVGGLQDGFSVSAFPSTTFIGIYSSGANNTIGGTLINTGNIIVSNTHGIYLNFVGDNSKIIRNKIGVGSDGTVNLGNGGVGIVLAGADDNYIGSTNPALGNSIAYNNTGIVLVTDVTAAKQNAILGNAIFQNTNQGIDFNNNGIAVPNDGFINFSDQNDGLDYPILDSSLNCGTSNTITYYTLSVPPSENYRVEFFSNSAPDASHGEGERYLGFTEVTVTSNPQSFSFDHGAVIPGGTNLSATVTRISTMGTSEFGANTTVQSPASAEISYSDICVGDTAFASLTGATGGVFRFSTPLPTDGAIIDASSGNVTNGVSGATYTVIYEVGSCSSLDTSVFRVIPVDAGFVYDDLCHGEDGLPTSINTLGGVFSFDPVPLDGASINPSTGEITGTTTGSYTIKYTLTADGCTQDSTQTISIFTENPSFSYDNICLGATGIPYDIATPGGAFSYFYDPPLDGSSINPISGELLDVEEGTTYNVVYTTANCSAKDTVPVTVVAVPKDFVFDDFCPSDTSPAPVMDGAIGTFSMVDLGDGATINADGSISSPVEGTTYTVTHSLTVDGCTESATNNVTAIVVDESISFPSICPGASGGPSTIAEPGGEFSFASYLGDGATIDPTTGLLENGVEGTTYNVQYLVTVGACSDSGTTNVAITSVEEGFEFPDFCPATLSPAPIVDEVGGTFSFGSPPGDGATISSSTGVISNPIEGNTYEVIHTKTTGGCSQDSTIFVAVKTISEGFTFADFCPAEISPIPEVESAGGVFTMTDLGDGATINADNGRITNPVEGTTYSVEHTITEDGCTETFTADVLAIEVDESFSFSPICPETSGTPFDIATSGGVFSFDPNLDDGAVLDPITGTLSNGVEGETYGVKYVVSAAGCTDSLTATVSIKIVQEGFSFPNFCPGTAESPAPILEGTAGTFTFGSPPGDGATINPITGVISNPVEGNVYTITHTKSESGCTQDSTLSVEVITIDSDFTLEDFCANGEGVTADPELGTYTFTTPATEGETIDPLTGAITGAIEGNSYSVDRTVDDGTCVETTTKVVNAVGIDESFTFESYCPALESPSPTSATLGGIYSFAPDLGDGASINSATGVITNGVEGSTYAVEYTVVLTLEDLTCTESDTVLVTVLATDESFEFDDFCAEFTGVPSAIGEAGGTFSFAPDLADGSLIDPSTGYLTNAVPSTVYTIEYSVGVCAEKDSISVLALAAESAEFTFPDHCANVPLLAEIGGAVGGVFSFVMGGPLDGASINSSTGEIFSPSAGGTYSVQYISPGADGYCADTSMVSVVRHPVPEIITLKSDDDVYCPEEIINPLVVADFSNTDQVYWMINTEIIDSGFSYTPDTLAVGETTFKAQGYNSFGCYSEIKTLTYIYSDISVMKAVEDFDICLGSSAELSAFGGDSYFWTTPTDISLTDPTLANQKVFSLNPQLYLVSIKDEFGCEVIDSVRVGFLPESECPVKTYNAFSPNNDGKNDFWYIDNIINFEPNKVIIYNRWGDILNEFENYDNVTVYWSGEDKNGNPLPPGTYFYVLIAEDEKQNQASWVEIVR